jgi:hypothetical protein
VQSQALDRAYVLFERFNKHQELFAELQSLKFRYMATLGKSAFEPFKELCDVRNEMVSAANELGTFWWPREKQGQLTEKDAEEKRKSEGIFWRKLDGNEDAIAQRVNQSVEKIETLLQNELRSRLSWWRRTWQWCKCRSISAICGTKTVPEVDMRLNAATS